MTYAEMTEEEKRTYRHECSVRGGKRRARAFTRDYQRKTRAHVSRESCAANGRKGFYATLQKYGAQKAQSYSAAWRTAHPSSHEQHVIDLLTAYHQIDPYEREYLLEDGRSLDFAWPQQKRAIEVNGHQNRPAFGESESRAERHARKVHELRSAGWDIFVYDPTAIDPDRQLIEWTGKETTP